MRYTLLLLLLAAPLSAQEKAKDAPYFPLKVGTTWVYRSGDRTITVRVAAQETVGQTVCARLEAADGDNRKTEHLAAHADGIYRHQEDGKRIEPPVCVLKLPPAAGQSWKWDSAEGSLKLTGTFAAAEEEVTVPAGKHKAVKVGSTDLDLGGLKAPVTLWFVKGLGPVKQRLVLNNREIVVELQSFTAGK
jgi:hypothetical protein